MEPASPETRGGGGERDGWCGLFDLPYTARGRAD